MTALLQPAEPIVITQYEVLLGDIKEAQDNAVESFDYETKQGDKDARSYIYKLRQLRAKIEAQRKAAKEYALDYGRAVDSQAKGLTQKVDELIAPHQKQLDDIAKREAARVAAHESRLRQVEALGIVTHGASSAEIREQLALLDRQSLDGLEEFADRVAAALARSRQTLAAALERAEVQEAEAAELQRLRAEVAERRRKEAEAAAAEAQRLQAEVAEESKKSEARAIEAEGTAPRPRHLQQPLPVGHATPPPQAWSRGGRPQPAGPKGDYDGWVELLEGLLVGKSRREVAELIVLNELHPAVSFDWRKMP